jgi:hypothetical protein
VFVDTIVKRISEPQKDKKVEARYITWSSVTLIPWSTVCLENLRVDELFRKFPACMQL